MHHQAAASAYSKVSTNVASPRELEAKALLKAAAKLQSVNEGEAADPAEMREAILFNRRLWTIFASSATAPENEIPQEIRDGIANLAVYVLTKTLEVEFNPSQESIRSIIEINKNIAAGLMGNAG